MVNETEPRPRSVALDVLFDVLADADRRRVLASLLDNSERTVDDLARTLAVADCRSPEQHPANGRSMDPPVDDVERHRLLLQHVHLPRLTDAGLVRYDCDLRVVALTDSANREKVTSLLGGLER